jgi:signal peptidase I
MSVGKKILKEIWEWFAVFAAAFVLVMLLNTAVFATTQVRQTSMQDTLFEGQHLFIDKLTYSFRNPSHGEIIVFIKDQKPKGYIERVEVFMKDISEIFKPIDDKTNVRLVKRVIGIPGDKVDIRDGKVFLNEKPLKEPYVKGETFQRDITFPVTVPKGKYLVFGDNREVSMDSRSFGFIERCQIEGRAVFRFWPLNKFGGVK